MAKKDYLFPVKPDMDKSRQRMLAGQHLEYARNLEYGRYLLTEHAMHNTELLMEYAVEIMQNNPEAAPALKEIMGAYLDATSGDIKAYGIVGIKYR